MKLLLDNGYIKHTYKGYVNQKGTPIGFYRCKGSSKKRYVEDKYKDIAVSLANVIKRSE